MCNIKILNGVLLIVPLFWGGCDQSKETRFKYPQNFNISDSNGTPKSNSVLYFSSFGENYSLCQQSPGVIDTFLVKIFSETLFKLNEPILYNTFTGSKKIRFSWFRSFDPEIVITLEDIGSALVVYQNKALQINYNYLDSVGNPINEKKIFKTKKIISENTKITLDSLLKKKGFFDMPSYSCRSGLDGAFWILEVHDLNNYHIVCRWAPTENEDKSFKEICEYILDLSDFKEERRY
jgi:hypothetical protein